MVATLLHWATNKPPEGGTVTAHTHTHTPSTHLAEDEHVAAVDQAVTRDDTITGVVRLLQAKVRAAVGHQAVVLCERPGVNQQLHTLPCGQLAALVLQPRFKQARGTRERWWGSEREQRLEKEPPREDKK